VKYTITVLPAAGAVSAVAMGPAVPAVTEFVRIPDTSALLAAGQASVLRDAAESGQYKVTLLSRQHFGTNKVVALLGENSIRTNERKRTLAGRLIGQFPYRGISYDTDIARASVLESPYHGFIDKIRVQMVAGLEAAGFSVYGGLYGHRVSLEMRDGKCRKEICLSEKDVERFLRGDDDVVRTGLDPFFLFESESSSADYDDTLKGFFKEHPGMWAIGTAWLASTPLGFYFNTGAFSIIAGVATVIFIAMNYSEVFNLQTKHLSSFSARPEIDEIAGNLHRQVLQNDASDVWLISVLNAVFPKVVDRLVGVHQFREVTVPSAQKPKCVSS